VAKPFNLTIDNRGRYRRQNLGKKVNETGQPVSATFFLGRDEKEAQRRVVLLEQVWEAVVKAADSTPAWDENTYAIALAVARGEQVISIAVPPGCDGIRAAYLADLQQLFPFLSLRFDDHAANARAQATAARWRQEGEELLNTASIIRKESSGTLHEALDAYAAYLTDYYAGKSNQRPQLRLANLLKTTHPDLPLDRLTADALDKWLALWNKRPTGKKGTLARATCRNAQIALRAFVRWLSRSEAFKWEIPRGYSWPRGRIDKLPADRKKQRLYFKRSELQAIWELSHPWDRALILLALNCGFSKREIATLRKDEIVKKGDRTFIKRHRTKSDVYGEWELWPETLAALDYLSQRPNHTEYAVVNERGNPLVNGTPTGNENQVIKNHWDRLMERVKADREDFHRLPFKCLRKTGATFVRKLASGEVASMYLAHGERADDKDQLLSVYTERPWRKVHRALSRLRTKMPFLTSVAEPWKATMFNKAHKAGKQILALREQGKTYEEIAAVVGLHVLTVGKICRQAKQGGHRR
jgi:integrase